MPRNIIVFDTETTDLIKNSLVTLDKQPRIIELYAVNISPPDDDGGEWIRNGEIEMLFNPGISIPEVSQKITGISDDMVSDCPTIGDRWDEIRNFFSGGDEVVAHNLFYDLSVMNFEQKRVSDNDDFPWPESQICTVEATEFLKGYRLSLTALHEELFGTGFPEAHRARNDVEALVLCYKRLYGLGYL